MHRRPWKGVVVVRVLSGAARHLQKQHTLSHFLSHKSGPREFHYVTEGFRVGETVELCKLTQNDLRRVAGAQVQTALVEGGTGSAAARERCPEAWLFLERENKKKN